VTYRTHITSTTLQMLGLTAMALVWLACEEPTPEVPCGQTLEAALVELGRTTPDPSSWAEASVYKDETVPGREGFVVDPTPMSRGDHLVERWWRDPATCQIEGGAYTWSPPQPRTESSPNGQTNLLTSFANPRVHALVIAGTDVGSRRDYDAWREALESIGAVGLTLFEPTRGEAEDAMAQACAELSYDDTFVLVTTGRGSPARGGSLHLRGEAWSYERISLLLGFHCADARTRFWVLDSPWAHGLSGWPLSVLPTRIWHASEPHHPNAPRVQPNGGGLLTAALTEHLVERAESMCLSGRPAEAEQVAWVFDDGAAVLDRMKKIRWDAVGPELLAQAGLGIEDLPAERHRLIEAVLEDLPSSITSDFGTPEVGVPCDSDDPCQLLISGCPMGACETWHCVAGRCQPAAAKGRPCDDGSACTSEDTCDALGLCTGDWIPCADGDPCTTDTCHWFKGCQYIDREAGDSCWDGDACTQGDVCDDQGICSGEQRDCDDEDPCTADSCVTDEGCIHGHATAPCDDLNPCTHQDYCHSGVCIGQPLPCYDENPCTLDLCDPKAGCAYVPTANGAGCDDADPCTHEEYCFEGECVGDLEICDDGLACTLDYCESGECVHLPPPGHCATQAGCTPVGEHPVDAPCLVCAATDVLMADAAQDGEPCAQDGLECTVDQCSDGVCKHAPAPQTCVTPDGDCVGIGEEIAPCLVCADTGIGQASGVGATCDDEDPCTEDETCGANGLCEGTLSACCPGDHIATCGSTLVGEAAPTGAPSLVSTWPCYADFAMPGPETVMSFTSSCNGTVTFHYDGPAGSLLFGIKDDPAGETAQSSCLVGACETYSPGGFSADLSEGESMLLVIDLWSGESLQGPYELETTCDCDP
jgi:hypothetical protein